MSTKDEIEEQRMTLVGEAKCGRKFPCRWQISMDHFKPINPHQYSCVEKQKAEFWPYISVNIPFETDKENDATKLALELELVIRNFFKKQNGGQ